MTEYACCNPEELRTIEGKYSPESGIIESLKVLTHPLRLKIIKILLEEDEICTCDLVSFFGVYQVQVTKQLIKLKKGGYLSSRKITFDSAGGVFQKEDGRWTAYSLRPEFRAIFSNILSTFRISNQFVEIEE